VQVYQSGPIIYYRFISFDDQGIYHAVFTRHGGISPTPWKSLNFGGSVGDDRNRVQQNKENALATLGIRTDSVYDVYQVHSSEIVHAQRPLSEGEPHIKADALITNTPGVTLMMRFADCVPIFLFDPVIRAIGITHAGWIGTINKIAGKTVMKMKEIFGTDPNSLKAAIGPSIGPDHYSVGADVVEKVLCNFGEAADRLIIRDNRKTYFDLWKANQLILAEAGVSKIETAEICTQCRLDDWYSHRGEHGNTGRFGVVMGLYS
jgi:YfiH family protein